MKKRLETKFPLRPINQTINKSEFCDTSKHTGIITYCKDYNEKNCPRTCNYLIIEELQDGSIKMNYPFRK